MVLLSDLAAFLDARLHAERYADDPAGVWHPARRPVARLGLALDPGPDLADWARDERLDAVFLHRPWRLAEHPLPDDVGVLAYHLAFDETLGLGHNLLLADDLGLHDVGVLGRKDGRPLGMTGACAHRPFDALVDDFVERFGGLETVRPPRTARVAGIAVVGAMRAALVQEAAARGAGLYLTGQERVPAREAVEATGIGVVAVGHARSERWALGLLRRLLGAHYPWLAVVPAPSGGTGA